MSYCVNCGVELDSTASFCPLCRTPVVNPPAAGGHRLSSPLPHRNGGRCPPPLRRSWPSWCPPCWPQWRCAAACSIWCCAAAISGPSMSSARRPCCGLAVPPLLLRTMHLYLRLSADVLAVALYVFLISVDLDGSAWYWHLALPIILLLGAALLFLGFMMGARPRSTLSRITLVIGHHRRFSLRRGAAHRPLLPGPLAAGLVPGGAHSMRCPGHPPHRGAPGTGPARGSAQALSSVIRSPLLPGGPAACWPSFSPHFDIFMRI